MALTEAQKRAKQKYNELHREEIRARARERARRKRLKDPDYEKRQRLKYAAYYKAYEKERHKRRYVPKKQGIEHILKRAIGCDKLPEFQRVVARSADGRSRIERWSALTDKVLIWYMVYFTDEKITMITEWDIKKVIVFEDKEF